MGQNSPLEQVPSTLRPLEPEEKREGNIEISFEEIRDLERQMNSLLNNYTIMADSFLMPADYATSDLEAKKKNKLRTAWFTLAFARLGESQQILGTDPDILKNLQQEFRAITLGETQQARLALAQSKIDFSDPNDLVQKFKEVKRDLAPQFIEAKIKLIEAVEFVLKRNLSELQKKYAS